MAFRRRLTSRRRKNVRRRTTRSRRSRLRRRNPVIRRSLFRSRGRIRRFNTGNFNVNTIMRYGQSLPQTAFGPCKFVVATQQHVLHGVVNNNNPSSPGYQYNDGRRTIVLSNLVKPYGWWQDSQLLQYIRCFGLFRLLYKRYIVLGAKVRIRLTPGMLPLRYEAAAGQFRYPATGPPYGMPNVGVPTGGGELGFREWNQQLNNAGFALTAGLPAYNPYLNTNPNIYWYVRVCLNQFSDNGTVITDPDVDIGHPMLANSVYNTVPFINTMGEYAAVPWSSLTDFLGDRTVAYSRDRRRWNTSSGVAGSGPINQAGGGTDLVATATSLFSANFNARTGATTLRYNYSLKKLIKDKNPLRRDSPFWRNIDEASLSQLSVGGAALDNFPRQEVTLRYGCVWFDPATGSPQFHYPIPVGFTAQTEIDYYCAWRDPVDIDTLNDPNLGDPAAGLNGSSLELSTKLAERRKLMETISNARLFQSAEEVDAILEKMEDPQDKEAFSEEEEYSEGQISESDYPDSEIEEELLEPVVKRARVQVVPRQVE